MNDEVVQDGTTDEMKWDMHYLVADLARNITLEPGDLILSGTPANSRPVQPGDVVSMGDPACDFRLIAEAGPDGA